MMMPTLTKTDVINAVVDAFLVKLATDPVTHLLSNANTSRDSLSAASQSLENQAAQAWQDAGQKALTHILLVVTNNPGKTIEQILVRPDVQDALSLPFQDAGVATTDAINSGWSAGVTIGQQQASADLQALGIPDVANDPIDSSSYLTDVLSDVTANVEAAPQRLADALRSVKNGHVSEAITNIVNDLSNRASLGVNVAVTRGATEAKLAKYAKAAEASGQSVVLLWVTHFRPTTCATCASLHGKMVPLGDSFSHTSTFKGKSLKVYGTLDGPPRHPNCGCQVVAYIVGKGPTTPKTMQAYAKQWWTGKGAGQ